MDGIEPLAKAIRTEKTERAKKAGIEEKLIDGPRLFGQACEAMRAGIRVLHPDASEAEIERMLWERNYGRRNQR